MPSLFPPGVSLEGIMCLAVYVCQQIMLHTTGPTSLICFVHIYDFLRLRWFTFFFWQTYFYWLLRLSPLLNRPVGADQQLLQFGIFGSRFVCWYFHFETAILNGWCSGVCILLLLLLLLTTTPHPHAQHNKKAIKRVTPSGVSGHSESLLIAFLLCSSRLLTWSLTFI